MLGGACFIHPAFAFMFFFGERLARPPVKFVQPYTAGIAEPSAARQFRRPARSIPAPVTAFITRLRLIKFEFPSFEISFV